MKRNIRKKIEVEEIVPDKISGNVYVLFDDVFCKNNKNIFSANHIKDITNLENGKTIKIDLPNYNPISIKLYKE